MPSRRVILAGGVFAAAALGTGAFIATGAPRFLTLEEARRAGLL